MPAPRPGCYFAQVSHDPLHERSVADLTHALSDGATDSVRLTRAALERIALYDQGPPGLNAVLSANPRALAEAEQRDRERRAGEARGVLHGIPVVVKDNIHVAGLPTTAGSAALAGWIASADAAVTTRLRSAGAIVVAKTNLHELAAGLTTVSSLGGQTRNPYDPSRHPGGSSGGTAAAVAASYAPLGWGTDTCGSIRIPAACCGLYGLRPTAGSGDMRGIVPLCSTQDVVGPLARTVDDLAVGLDATFADAHSNAQPGPFRRSLATDRLAGRRIGVLGQAFGTRSAAERAYGARAHAALESMAACGAALVPVRIEGLQDLMRDASLIVHEFKFDLADFLAAHEGAPLDGLGSLVETGLHHLALDARFRKRARPASRDTPAAREARLRQRRLRERLIATLDDHALDALAYPTMRQVPTFAGEPFRGSNAALSAHSGLPALAMPAGRTRAGLPVSIEMLGRPGSERRLVGMAYAYEAAGTWRSAPPTTPPLGDGGEPETRSWELRTPIEPETRITLRLDAPRGLLHYTWTRASGDDPVLAVLLCLRGSSRPGPVLGSLGGERSSDSGVRALDPKARHALTSGLTEVRLLTRSRPLGAVVVPVPAAD